MNFFYPIRQNIVLSQKAYAGKCIMLCYRYLNRRLIGRKMEGSKLRSLTSSMIAANDKATLYGETQDAALKGKLYVRHMAYEGGRHHVYKRLLRSGEAPL